MQLDQARKAIRDSIIFDTYLKDDALDKVQDVLFVDRNASDFKEDVRKFSDQEESYAS